MTTRLVRTTVLAMLVLTVGCGDGGGDRGDPGTSGAGPAKSPLLFGAPVSDVPAAAAASVVSAACGAWGSIENGRGDETTMCFGKFTYLATFVAPGDQPPVFKVRTPEKTASIPFVKVEGESRAELDLTSLGFAERAWAVFAQRSCRSRDNCSFLFGGTPLPAEEIEMDATQERASVDHVVGKGCRVHAALAGRGNLKLSPMPRLSDIGQGAVQPEEQGIAGFVYGSVGTWRIAEATGASEACGVVLPEKDRAGAIIVRDAGAGVGYYAATKPSEPSPSDRGE